MYLTLVNMQPDGSHSLKRSDNSSTPHHTIFLESEITVGVHDYERCRRQAISLIVQFEHYDHSDWPKEDEGKITQAVKDYLRTTSPELIEKLAYDVAIHLADSFTFLRGIRVTIQKPAALLKARCAYVSAYIKRA